MTARPSPLAGRGGHRQPSPDTRIPPTPRVGRALLISLGLNLALAGLVLGFGLRLANRPGPQAFAPQPPTPDPTATVAPSPTTVSGAAAPARPPFRWAQIESDDYPQYIENLRQVGCPERLIRELIVEDVGALYERRRAALSRPRLPPWAGQDLRDAAEDAWDQQRAALDTEQRAVLTALLGFPWDREALANWREEPVAWVLLGFLTDDQAMQVMSLAEPLSSEARHLRDRVHGVLLAEDQAALEALANRWETDLLAVVTPPQQEELSLRLQALGMAFGHDDLHLEAAGLTPEQARQVVRLSREQHDFVRHQIIGIELSEADRAARQTALQARLESWLGARGFAEFSRAQDSRFREVLDFTRERQLPREVARAAFEIRQAAETEAAQAAAADPDPTTLTLHLEQLQFSAAAALTSLLGPQAMGQYLEQERGGWLNDLGTAAATSP